MTDKRSSIADGIRAYRARADMTQDELAASIGSNPSTIGSWESGKSVPSSEMAWKLADTFGVPIDTLVGRTDG